MYFSQSGGWRSKTKVPSSSESATSDPLLGWQMGTPLAVRKGSNLFLFV